MRSPRKTLGPRPQQATATFPGFPLGRGLNRVGPPRGAAPQKLRGKRFEILEMGEGTRGGPRGFSPDGGQLRCCSPKLEEWGQCGGTCSWASLLEPGPGPPGCGLSQRPRRLDPTSERRALNAQGAAHAGPAHRRTQSCPVPDPCLRGPGGEGDGLGGVRAASGPPPEPSSATGPCHLFPPSGAPLGLSREEETSRPRGARRDSLPAGEGVVGGGLLRTELDSKVADGLGVAPGSPFPASWWGPLMVPPCPPTSLRALAQPAWLEGSVPLLSVGLSLQGP